MHCNMGKKSIYFENNDLYCNLLIEFLKTKAENISPPFLLPMSEIKNYIKYLLSQNKDKSLSLQLHLIKIFSMKAELEGKFERTKEYIELADTLSGLMKQLGQKGGLSPQFLLEETFSAKNTRNSFWMNTENISSFEDRLISTAPTTIVRLIEQLGEKDPTFKRLKDEFEPLLLKNSDYHSL